MHSRTPRKVWIALLVLFVACLPRLWAETGAATSSAPLPVEPVRYHFGDDPDGKLQWADPNFDDSAWPIAENGRWPMPPFYSDGFVWVRYHIPVRADAYGSLSVRSERPLALADYRFTVADELFVNGVQVGHQGSLPPRVELSLHEFDEVFNVPTGAAVPGAATVVAFRVWCPPDLRRPGWFGSVRFSIDESRNLQLAYRADSAASLVANGPDLALNCLIGLLGVGLLVLWRWAGGRELLLCSWLLISMTVDALVVDLSSLGLLAGPWREYTLIYVALTLITMALGVEFWWGIHGLRSLYLKRLAQAAILIFNCANLIVLLATHPSPIVSWSLLALTPVLVIFNSIQAPVNLWVLLFWKRNRLIAASFALISISGMLQWFGILTGHTIGPFYVRYFGLAFFLCEFTLFAMLAQRGWQAWRARDELRVEFEAAREVQEQLVAPAVDVPGFKIESAYAPARQVGGDFFRVIPDEGGVLVVVGDVSGKGLRAAMTVSSIIGALRTMPQGAGLQGVGRTGSPAQILEALNRGLVGNLQGGFVTCCVARIKHDGTVTIANAGHLSPYCNGAEVVVGAGLPLGIFAEGEYEESQFVLEPDKPLVFLSDGVVEARNAAGELFGFDRTLRISRSSAQAIAHAAVTFGQDDDITVLTITRLRVAEESVGLHRASALGMA